MSMLRLLEPGVEHGTSTVRWLGRACNCLALVAIAAVAVVVAAVVAVAVAAVAVVVAAAAAAAAAGAVVAPCFEMRLWSYKGIKGKNETLRK
eukprot:202083-Pelagomonas_calceolata.AAC.7